MARLLAPADFGVVALALFFINLAANLQAFGLEQALIHRVDIDEKVTRTYFSLRILLILGGLLVLLGVSPLIGRAYPNMPLLMLVLIVLGIAAAVEGLSSIQETLLRKALRFRQLATIDVLASIVMTVVGPVAAYLGAGAWALVAEQASGIATRCAIAWLVFRPLSLKFGWDQQSALWFWKFGKANWGAANLRFIMDRFDDFWVGTRLGGSSLGFYSRSYEFARYTRRAVANPLVSVFTPIFARLQDDRIALSRAFYRGAFLMVRVGFLLSGAFALLMPEFIDLVLGEKWRPMLVTFRLMLVYSLLDSLIVLGEGLLVAVGRPRWIRRMNALQALVLIPSVLIGASLGGIEGVAIAADFMLMVGIAAMFTYLKTSVDLSLLRLFIVPTAGLALAWVSAFLIESNLRLGTWSSALAKLGVFVGVFFAFILLFEGKNIAGGIRWAVAHFRNHG